MKFLSHLFNNCEPKLCCGGKKEGISAISVLKFGKSSQIWMQDNKDFL